MKQLLFALLMLPGICCADSLSERADQNQISSLFIPSPAAFLNRVPASLMLSGFCCMTPPCFTMGGTATSRQELSGEPLSSISPLLDRRVSATTVGELALSRSIGVFGQFGLSPSASDLHAADLNEGTSDLLQLARHYGVGVNVWTSEALALHFEWERYAPEGKGADFTLSDWDTWKQKNVFGAGLRFGL